MKNSPRRPLSIWTYFIRNRSRTVPIVGILALAVFGISLSVVLSGSLIRAAEVRIAPYQQFCLVRPNTQSGYTAISQGVRLAMEELPSFEAAYPLIELATSVPGLMGKSQVPVYAVDAAALDELMARFGLHVIAGQLPRGQENGLVLHEKVARARRLSIGDEIGRELDETEWLPGRFRIAALVSGPSQLSFVTLAALRGRSDMEWPVSMLAVAPPARLELLGRELAATLPVDQVRLETYALASAKLHEEFFSMNAVIMVINLVLTVVLALVVGLLNLVQYVQRDADLAFLQAIGYARGFLMRQTLVESLGLACVAWLVGVFFSQVLYVVVSRLFISSSIELTLLDARALVFTLPVPVMVGLFSASTAIWTLRRQDPIAIIDRRR